MNIKDQLEISAAAREALEALHGNFMDAVHALKEPNINGAEFRCIDGELEVICLGVNLRARHRLIALDGKFEIVEYKFIAQYEGAVLDIWSMYLAPNGSLYIDIARNNFICDMTNQYLPSRVAPHIASKLLASKMFSSGA